MITIGKLSGLILGFGVTFGALAGDYENSSTAADFVAKMVEQHKFKAEDISAVLNQAEKKQSILDAIARPAEKTKPWFEYRPIFLGQDRIDQGVQFWRENHQTLSLAEQTFGVEAQIIVAIIGVETRYGKHMGSYRVVDALATLAFDYPPRSEFFSGQLEQLFLLAREQKQDPLSLFGSYAGAMGYGQFIPSSYRHFARDFDNDGFADIWENKRDAIGSVANYFKAHGWQAGQPVLQSVKLAQEIDESLFNSRTRPDIGVKTWRTHGVVVDAAKLDQQKAVLLRYEQPDNWDYWLGFNNFYVITRYNRSHLYAMAVWQLSEEILRAKIAHEKSVAKPKSELESLP